MVLTKLLTSTFGSRNIRTLKRLQKKVNEINTLSDKIAAFSDEELKNSFARLRARYDNGEGKGESLEKLLPEAYAVVREGGERILNMRHFDAQLLGGLVLYEGNITEMKTGEGKTLVATLPVYLRALEGKGVHMVTVNDYLAKRDAEWMGKLYEGLGMSVGVIYSQQPQEEKKEAYMADVTYGTNNEFGFDYLRDNLVIRPEQRMQRELNYAIVDEVDSILIDEARTPLIISGPREDSVELYQKINALIPPLSRQINAEDGTVVEEGDYVLDEKGRMVEVTDTGHEKVEDALIKIEVLKPGESLYDMQNIHLLHHVQAALKAHHLFKRNVSYLVQNGKIVIVDEHTGRSMPGRRWSEGIHQAVEAKESVEVQQENQTLASTTFQNYFRLYDTLAGMTGTADTEAYEFHEIYELDVVVIPTNQKMIRDDMNDTVFMTRAEKYKAIIEDIKQCQITHRPVLVGTASVESSEELSSELDKMKISHNVLNAKNPVKEADIISGAGKPDAITIATNMAGRGTDIVLGGNLEKEIQELGDDASEQKIEVLNKDWQEKHDLVIKQGGLHVIGSERHESRRIDNQLRGRSGRQGDPGSSHFYLSMEDDLLRLFTPERVVNVMRSLGLPEGEPIEHKMITNAIERAQRKVEGRNFDIRKQLLEYDDVANNQRLVIYRQRREIMDIEDLGAAVKDNIQTQVRSRLLATGAELQGAAEQNTNEINNNLVETMRRDFAYTLDVKRIEEEGVDKLGDELPDEIYQHHQEKFNDIGEDIVKDLEKQVMLQVLDNLWRDHNQTMDYLRQGIHLRGYAQRNPKEEYKREAYAMFDRLLEKIKFDTARILCNVSIRQNDEQVAERRAQSSVADESKLNMRHEDVGDFGGVKQRAQSQPPQPQGQASGEGATFTREGEKVGRNQPCPCGSGKKYKHCHGRAV